MAKKIKDGYILTHNNVDITFNGTSFSSLRSIAYYITRDGISGHLCSMVPIVDRHQKLGITLMDRMKNKIDSIDLGKRDLSLLREYDFYMDGTYTYSF